MITLNQIGVVSSQRTDTHDDNWGDVESVIELRADLPAESLAGLEDFSHAEIVFVFDHIDEQSVVTGSRHPRNNPEWPKVGIFAQRASRRPNRLGVTIVTVLGRDGSRLRVKGLDAADGTPVVDIKPVMAEFLPREPVRQPAWSHELMREYWRKMPRFDFLVETYRTERLKTLSVWSQIPDGRMRFRPEPRARSPLEHMVHQCVSEDLWMRNMLGIAASLPALPPLEIREAFIDHYGRASAERVDILAQKPDEWFDGGTTFFDVPRSRAWVLTRRFTHSAHHRGQLMVYLRLWGQAVYSTYGPTADTGGLFQNGARVIYRDGAPGDPSIPVPVTKPVTERPEP